MSLFDNNKRIKFFFLILLFYSIIVLFYNNYKTKMTFKSFFQYEIKFETDKSLKNIIENFENKLKEINLADMEDSEKNLYAKSKHYIDNLIMEISNQTDILSRNILKEKSIQHGLRIYDLKAPNKEKFECVESAFIMVKTTICIHDIEKDLYISKAIKDHGVWESQVLELFMKILSQNKNIHVFDIGANLGQFCMYAAKLNRICIAVEPFYDNLIRFHKSVQIENLTDNIILIANGVSDKREIKRLNKNDFNIGGQGIIEESNRLNISKEIALRDKYNIETVFLDDLIPIIPPDFNEAIIKIDIEYHEIYALKKINELLDRVKIYAIIMEWSLFTNTKDSMSEIEYFLDFIYSKGYTCKTIDLYDLRRKDWIRWPSEIVWFRSDFDLKNLI